LATFLRQLHTVPVKEAIPLTLPSYNGHAAWVDMYARLQEKVFPHMRPDARQWATHHFETFLDDASRLELEPVLIHGDFGPSNILYNADAQTISGIIDFGSAGWGDPAADFASLIGPFGYGESFLRRFYDIYPEIEAVMERAKFYVGTFALQDALFGIENDDQETFKSGIATYV